MITYLDRLIVQLELQNETEEAIARSAIALHITGFTSKAAMEEALQKLNQGGGLSAAAQAHLQQALANPKAAALALAYFHGELTGGSERSALRKAAEGHGEVITAADYQDIVEAMDIAYVVDFRDKDADREAHIRMLSHPFYSGPSDLVLNYAPEVLRSIKGQCQSEYAWMNLCTAAALCMFGMAESAEAIRQAQQSGVSAEGQAALKAWLHSDAQQTLGLARQWWVFQENEEAYGFYAALALEEANARMGTSIPYREFHFLYLAQTASYLNPAWTWEDEEDDS